MNCKHCKSDLDGGDILDYFIKVHDGDRNAALETAFCYGVTETNREHFKHEVIVQPRDGPQWVECKFCGGVDPLSPGLTLKEAIAFRQSLLQEYNSQRKERVNKFVAKSLSFEEVEKTLRNIIKTHPNLDRISVKILEVTGYEFDLMEQDKMRKEVGEELNKKYGTAFAGCKIVEMYICGSITFSLTMDLSQ